jgi:hypothetical protein
MTDIQYRYFSGSFYPRRGPKVNPWSLHIESGVAKTKVTAKINFRCEEAAKEPQMQENHRCMLTDLQTTSKTDKAGSSNGLRGRTAVFDAQSLCFTGLRGCIAQLIYA